MSTADYIALRELLNEAKCRMERARRRANEALADCTAREDAYANACQTVRDLELQVEKLHKRQLFGWFA